MKSIKALFVLLLWNASQLYSQENKLFYDIGAYFGGSLGNNYKINNLKINAYGGIVLGGFAAFNKNRLSLRLHIDYVPTSIKYTFTHPDNQAWSIHSKDGVNLINYGFGVGFRFFNNPKTNFKLLLGMVVVQKIFKQNDKTTIKEFSSFYDPAINQMNSRLVLAVRRDWGDPAVFSPYLGFEYQLHVGKIPIMFQWQILRSENIFSSNKQKFQYIAFTNNIGSNEIVQKTDWKSNWIMRLNLGISLFSSNTR